MDKRPDNPPTRPVYIAVLGRESYCEPEHARLAEQAGRQLAARKAVPVCGGTGGVFTHVCKGARQGETIALTSESVAPAKSFCKHIIPTGMGAARHVIIANTCQGALLLGGWSGSLKLALTFLEQGKPVVALQGTGGVADSLGGQLLLPGSAFCIETATTISGAIQLLFERLSSNPAEAG